jgi:hypothetical protein
MVHITGGCQCGAVRYETDADPVFAGHCQCNDCKKSSGAGHVTGAAFPAAAVKITGKLKGYSSKADSGGTATREFCPECGSRVSFRSTSMPGMVILTAGTMDNPGAINPGMVVYNKRHVAWDHFDPGTPVFDTVPPRN